MSNEEDEFEKQLKQCDASPLEVLNYYLVYPNELIKDAYNKSQDVYVYLQQITIDALNQLNNNN